MLASSVSEMESETVLTPGETGSVCAKGGWGGCGDGVDVGLVITTGL